MIYLLTDHAKVQLKLNKNITIPRQALLLQASAIYSDKFSHICFFLLWENVFELSPLEVTAKYLLPLRRNSSGDEPTRMHSSNPGRFPIAYD